MTAIISSKGVLQTEKAALQKTIHAAYMLGRGTRAGNIPASALMLQVLQKRVSAEKELAQKILNP